MTTATGNVLEQKLTGLRVRVRLLRFAGGLLLAAAFFLLLALVCYHIDRLDPLTRSGRTLWLTLLGGGGALAAFGAAAAAFLPRCSDIWLAGLVERRFPDLKERLLTTLELSPALLKPENVPFSLDMARALAAETEAATAEMDFTRAADTRFLKRCSMVFAAAGALFALDAALAGPAFAVWMQRMLHPRQDIAPYAATRVQILPDRTLLPTGSALTLTVRTWGVPAANAQLRVRSTDDAAGAWQKIALLHAKTEGHQSFFHAVLPHLAHTVQLVAFANDGRSNLRTITVAPRPGLVSTLLTLHYPAYMHRAAQKISAPDGSFAAPQGTRVEVRAVANNPLQQAEVRINGRLQPGWAVHGSEAAGTFLVTRDASYTVSLKDDNGFTNPQPPVSTIHAEIDQPPAVQIDHPARDMELTPDGSLPLVAHATDDYGVVRMDLNFTRTRQDESRVGAAAVVHEGGASFALPGQYGSTAVQTGVRWHIASTHAEAGDTVHYDVDAVDNDTWNGPHVTHSMAYNVRIISLPEMQLRLQSRIQQEQRALRQLIQRQNEAHSQLQKAEQHPDAAHIAQAQETQRAVAQDAQTLKDQVHQLTQDLQNNNLATPSDLQRRQEAEQTLKADAGQKMNSAADSAQNAQQKKGGARQQQLQRAGSRQQQIAKDLQHVHQLLRPTPTASQLAQRASELAQQQQQQADGSRAMAQDLHKQDLKVAQQQQQQTSAATRQLQQDMQRAAQDAQQRGDSATAKALQQAEKALQQGKAEQNQSQAEQQLQKSSPAKAAPSQDAAARALQQAADAAQQAAQNPQNAQQQLSQAAQALQQMANQQKAIAKQLQASPQSADKKALQKQEEQLKQQAGRQQQNLQGAPNASQSLGQAQQSLGSSAQKLQKSAQSAQQPAEKAAQQLQKSADQAKQAAQQLAQDEAARKLAGRVARLAQLEHGIHDVTARLETDRQKNALNYNDLHERRQVGARQQNAQTEAEQLAEQFPSAGFQKALRMAAHQMDMATKNLNRDDPDTGRATQRSEQHAADTLDAIARALQQQAQNSGSQQNQNSQSGQSGQSGASPQQQQAAEALGELMLAQGLQQELRHSTQQLEGSKPSDAGSARQKQDTGRLAKRQQQTQSITRGAQQHLQQVPKAAHSAGLAQQQMGMAHQRLQQNDPGSITRHHQDAAINQLNQAIQQTQQALQQMQQQQQAQQQAQQGAPQPMKPGSMPQQGPFTRLQKPQGGAVSSTTGPQSRAPFVSPRTRRALNQGRHDPVPPEYQALVHGYYTRLSKEGKGRK